MWCRWVPSVPDDEERGSGRPRWAGRAEEEPSPSVLGAVSASRAPWSLLAGAYLRRGPVLLHSSSVFSAVATTQGHLIITVVNITPEIYTLLPSW